MREQCERDEDCEPQRRCDAGGRPRPPAPRIDDGEEPEREHEQVHGEERDERLAPDGGIHRVERSCRHEQQAAGAEEPGQDEQDDPAQPFAGVELAAPGTAKESSAAVNPLSAMRPV